jgi:hypothetical protein
MKRATCIAVAAALLPALSADWPSGPIIPGQPRGGYVVYEGYDAPYPYRCHHGYWARQRLYDSHGNFVGWSQPHFFCR